MASIIFPSQTRTVLFGYFFLNSDRCWFIHFLDSKPTLKHQNRNERSSAFKPSLRFGHRENLMSPARKAIALVVEVMVGEGFFE